MYCAIGVEPTNEIDCTTGEVSSPSTASLSPWSTVNTPSGRPASFHSDASHSAADGSFSLGLSTTALPAAIAMGKNHSGTIAGKLNGLMMPTTPSGCFSEYTSMPVDAFSVNAPLVSAGNPVARSTTSRPRAISPIASEVTLPCSAVMIAASSPLRSFSSCRNAKSTVCRFATE